MTDGSDARRRFPLGLCIASIAGTSLGLVAAVGNVQWGVAQGEDGLARSWLYVNVLLVIVCLVFWPMTARAPGVGALGRQALAIFLGALPALAVAAFLSGAAWAAIFSSALLHLSFALFAGGLLAASGRTRVVAALPAIAALALPVALFIVGETFPRGWSDLAMAVPAVAVAHTARLTSAPNATLYGVAAIYTGIGMACWASARIRSSGSGGV